MYRIVCIGAGKLANHLMPALELAGCSIMQIFSRTKEHGETLALQLKGSDVVTSFKHVKPEADFYFITVADDAIKEVASHLPQHENSHSVYVHCSGIQPLNKLPFERRGIFYPLQSFSPGHQVDWKNTPLLITAETPEIHKQLVGLAQTLSDLVYQVSEEEKAVLHLAAVFANNFTNHMLAIAEELCQRHQVSFEILKPIIRETIAKALDVGALNSQTGPAMRGDRHTIEKHLQMLDSNNTWKEIYKDITKSIVDLSTNNKH